MFGEELTLSVGQLLWFGINAYFLVLGSLMIFSNRKLSLLAFSMISLSLAWLMGRFPWSWGLSEVFLMAIWPFFYLYLKHQVKKDPSNWQMLIHLVGPAVWLILVLQYPDAADKAFQPFWLLLLIGYLIPSTIITYRITVWKKPPHSYLHWMHYGLILLILSRLILPVFMTSAESHVAVFNGMMTVYFLGLSVFFIRSPIDPTEVYLEQEDGLNYEMEMKRKLDGILKKDKAYLIPDLTLGELSNRMQVRSAELSTFFNTNIGKNFNDVINEYRVAEVQRLIKDPGIDPKSTMMELAYQAGFNSKASFNRIFKRVTGVTPKEFKKSAQPITAP